MKVLSLFDGISGGQQALNLLGIRPEYYASEIDPYSIKVTQKNFPATKQLGDVTKLDYSSIGGGSVDLLIGGSPCQDLSIAGKGAGLDGERSGLFWEYIKALETLKPKYFLLENVASMKDEWRDQITKVLGVQPMMINSARMTAQQRKRYYWTNIKKVMPPKNLRIYLRDILLSGDSADLKSLAITANYSKLILVDYIKKKQGQMVFDIPDRLGSIIGDSGQGGRIYSVDGKSVSLSANGGGRGASTGTYLCASSRGRNIVNGKRQDYKHAPTQQRFEFRSDQKTNCLTSVDKDNYIADFENWIIRKLHPIECERLQGFSDNYTAGISNTQRYKGLGNSFTVPVIAHILSHIPRDMYTDFDSGYIYQGICA